MSGRTGRQVVADENQLQRELSHIGAARQVMAEFAADPDRWSSASAACKHIGALEYYVTELAAMLELRQDQVAARRLA